jgi:hypothetical protein
MESAEHYSVKGGAIRMAIESVFRIVSKQLLLGQAHRVDSGAGKTTAQATEWLVGVQHTLARYYYEYITSRQSTRRGLYIRRINRSTDHHAV